MVKPDRDVGGVEQRGRDRDTNDTRSVQRGPEYHRAEQGAGPGFRSRNATSAPAAPTNSAPSSPIESNCTVPAAAGCAPPQQYA